MTSQRPWIGGLPTRLRIDGPLGHGATSSVWRARDLVAGIDVVVKVLDAEHAAGRLEREARALARLRDVPGVVVAHELGRSDDGTGWIVCDLAAGGSLRDRLGERGAGPLESTEARRLAAALAAALAEVHERGVVHGDLSPANVLFDRDGAPLLADFGAADLDGTSDPVRQGLTPAFAAPERRRGAVASRPGDVYSLAATVATACHTPDEPLAGVLAE
ncbi:MAG: serine/threonine protein kinase, partial [Actinomycetota bacterium]|nr:serine/threonine protein kinase [Actinomycetota bacterium]